MSYLLPNLKTRTSAAAFTLGIASLLVVGIWVFFRFDFPETVLDSEQVISVSVTRTEMFLLLILLFLNILTAYAIFRRMQPRMAPVRASISIIMVTFLMIVIWVSRIALQEHGIFVGEPGFDLSVQRLEILLVMLLIVANLGALLVVLRKFKTAKNFITLSAYSKKVKYNGQWIPLEQWLENEFGIQVSHGITPEERQKVLAGLSSDRPLNADDHSRR